MGPFLFLNKGSIEKTKAGFVYFLFFVLEPNGQICESKIGAPCVANRPFYSCVLSCQAFDLE